MRKLVLSSRMIHREASSGMNHLPQYVRLEALLTIVPFSASTVWRKVENLSFPKPVRLSSRITAWKLETIEAWLAEQEAQ